MPPQSPAGKQTYVARAGNVYISTDEFVKRFEMLPGLFRHPGGRLEEDKLVFLYSLIGEKLLAQEALARKLDTNTAFRASLGEIRTMLARDELYRREISNKVSVSRSEIREGIARARKELIVSYLFFDREEDARQARKRLSRQSDLASLTFDPSVSFLRDTITVSWGAAQPEIEEAVFALKGHEISPVVQAGPGFYILTVLDAHPDKFYSAMQPDVIRERVMEKIRLRKEKILALEFIENFLKHQTGYTRSAPFNTLCGILHTVALRQSHDTAVTFTPGMWDEVRQQTASLPDDSMVVAGATMLRVSDVVDLIRAKEFTVDPRRMVSIRFVLNSLLRDWVHQQLLGAEAVRQGLDRSPSVLRELEVWRGKFLAELMKAYVKAHVALTEPEFQSALVEAEHRPLPRVQIRELRTRSLDSLQQALRDLMNGAQFESVIRQWSDDAASTSRDGVSEFFPITSRPPIGEIAWGMKVGERYGPVSEESTFVFFELVAKDSVRPVTDSARSASLRQEVLQMKQRRTMDQFLAQLGDRHGFDVYQESLTQAEVSGTPMMTFRLLGFGGKMFAAPFVDRQIDWVNVEPPTGTIIP